MDSERKVDVATDLSEPTNNLSVVADDSNVLSNPAAEKASAKEADKKEESDREDRDRKKRRKDSKDRGDRRSSRERSGDRSRKRSHRDRSSSRDGRRRSSDRHSRHDRDKDGDKGKDKEGLKDEKSEDKDKEKERDRDGRSGRSDRDRDRTRERSRDGDRSRGTRDRDVRDKDRRSRRSNSPGRRRTDSRSRSPGRRRGRDSRRRSRSVSSDEGRRRNRRRSRSASPDKKKSSNSNSAEADPAKPKPVTLRDIIAANPGISVAEAAIRLNAYNTAVARGLTPDPINAPIHGAAQVGGGAVSALGGAMPIMGAGGMGMSMGMGMGMGAAAGMGGMPGMGAAGEGGASTKAQRELYVGNLPPGITVPQLAEFLNAAFKQLGLCKDATQNTVITAWVSPESHYAFVELRTIDEATAALTYLNGIQVGMYSLKFGRPKGYTGGATSSVAVPMTGGLPAFNNPLLTSSMLGAGPGMGVSNPLLAGLSGSMGMGGAEALSNVIMVTNLPSLISEQQIRELFTPFGELKAFNVIKTPTGQSQSAVFEYVNSALTDGVVGGMNNLDIAGQKLSVQRVPASSAAVLLQPNATPSAPTPAPPAGPPPPPPAEQPDELASYPPSAVIRMSNMTTPQDLSDDQSYEELLEDVADECNSHGTVKSIIIPRTGDAAAVGKIFVHFVDVAGAQASRKAVAGRKFNGRVVEAVFFPEELFTQKVYALPPNYLHEKASRAEHGPAGAGNGAGQADLNDIDEGDAPQGRQGYDPAQTMEDLD